MERSPDYRELKIKLKVRTYTLQAMLSISLNGKRRRMGNLRMGEQVTESGESFAFAFMVN